MSRHGRKQLEIQLSCILPRTGRKARYELGVYLLFPRSLQMNRSRYGEKAFLQDILSYTRFCTPSIPMRGLSDPACDKSPLIRLLGILRGTSLRREVKESRIEYELRTLVNIHNTRFKEGVREQRNLVRTGRSDPDAGTRVERMLRESDAALGILREELHPLFLESHVSERLRKALARCEESLSLAVEKHLYELHALIGKQPALESLRADFLERVRRERAYRGLRGFHVAEAEADTAELEARLHHESELKKWAQQTYYMTQERDRSVHHLHTVCMAFAAMLAMSFAVAVTFLATIYFPQNSVPLALALVVTYAFKDRIKESARAFFLHLLPRMVSDRRDRLISPDRKPVGNSQLRVGFSSESKLPDILRALLHNNGGDPDLDLPERDLLLFHKRLMLRVGELRKTYSRLDAITEILRFRTDDWLSYMDDPQEDLWLLDGESPRRVKLNRTYPVKLFLHVTSLPGNEEEVYAYDLHLNRKGIQRIMRAGRR